MTGRRDTAAGRPPEAPVDMPTAARAQTALPALLVALSLVALATGLGLVIAEGAIAADDRQPGERRAAASLADGLVAPASPLTVEPNVLDWDAVAAFDGADLRAGFPVVDDISNVRVALDGTVIATTGDATGGTTMRRLVAVQTRSTRTLEPTLGRGRRVTLPRRTPNATLYLDPPENTTLRAVRAEERVVLHEPGGLDGRYEVALSQYETATLRFAASGPLPRGSIRIVYAPPRTEQSRLKVTVDG